MLRSFPTLRIGALTFAIIALLGSVPLTTYGQVTNQQKIELMAKALRARSDGDLETARKRLEELILLVPEDINVQRLYASINDDISRARGGPPAPGKIRSTQAEIDAAVAEESVQMKQQDLQSPETLEKSLDKTIAATDSNEKVEKLLAKGRAQFIAGEYKRAEDTFNEVEAIEPDNLELSKYRLRMAQMKPTSNPHNSSPRDQMLDEVTQAWQRPQIYNRESVRQNLPMGNGLSERMTSITIPKIYFDGVPLSKVVETLSALSVENDEKKLGVNLVLINQPGTDPSVTISLRQLSLNRIMDFITESVGYEYDVQNDAVVIRLGSGQGTRLETDFFPLSRSTIIRLTGINGIDSGKPSHPDPLAAVSGPTPSHPPEEETLLMNFLQRAGVPFDTINGATMALADGQLIVTQTPRNLEKVRNILRRYSDLKQVEIEARFIEIQQGDLEELGFNWNVRTGGKPTFDTSGNPVLTNTGKPVMQYNQTFSNDANRSLSNAFGTSTAGNSRLIITQPNGTVTDPVAAPNVTNSIDLAADAITPLAKIGGVMGEFDVDLIIRALSRKQGNDLLSAPKLTVLSGKTAQIVVAQELRYPESFSDIQAQVGRGESSSGSAGVAITAGTPQNFTMRNVGVEMEVTPTVEDDNSISLSLEPKVTEFEGYVEYGGPSIAIASGTTVKVPSGFFQPIFSVRKVRTEVTIWDGATVVMGGLTREQAVTVQDKVPVLGDIPVLGRLFKSKGESSQKRNLLIFVTANLISPGGSPSRQQFNTVDPGALFQNPVIVTPGGAINRSSETN